MRCGRLGVRSGRLDTSGRLEDRAKLAGRVLCQFRNDPPVGSRRPPRSQRRSVVARFGPTGDTLVIPPGMP